MAATVALVKARPGPGEVAANEAKILQYARRAGQLGAAVTVFPELMLTGVGPSDLGAGDDLRRHADQALTRLARALDREGLGGRHVVVGTTGTGLADRPTNAAAVLHKGKVALATASSDHADDAVFSARGHRFALAIGRVPGPVRAVAADAVLVLADGLAYAADQAGHPISPAPADHEGLTLWTAK
ncbi:MAG: hypothetical protein LBC97_08610 [Bifidobacteriaceae bacterium]|jgi:predicted amidohydrolase|nr:hypothetical protein [Bifidobacteriaceae bacterium]